MEATDTWDTKCERSSQNQCNPATMSVDPTSSGDHAYFAGDLTVIVQQNKVVTPPNPTENSEEPIVSNSKLYMYRKEELSMEELQSILKDPDLTKISSMPPNRPKGGEVYMYKLENEIQKRNIRCDQYVWHERGSCPLPRKKKFVKRYYFTIRGADGEPNEAFKKYEHILYSAFGRLEPGRPQEINYPCYAIVQYVGDETVFQPWVHKNSKKASRPYVRLLSSVRKEIEKNYNDVPPQQVFNLMTVKSVGSNLKSSAVSIPNSASQIHDIQKNLRRRRTREELQMKHVQTLDDDFEMASETARQLPGFFLSAVTNPQKRFSLINLGLAQMLNEVNRVLQLDRSDSSEPICFYVHRRYQFGQTCLTLLSFRHPLFEDDPMMPAAFLISQGAFQEDFSEFFRSVADNCEELREALFALITDVEIDSTTEADIFLGATGFTSWRYIESTVEKFYDRLCERSRSLETVDYWSDISRVLSMKVKTKALTELDSMKSKWSTAFLKFYEDSLSDVVSSSGRWSTEPLNLYDPFLGVKTCYSNHYENLFTNLEQWQDIPANALIICMYHFQQFFCHNIDLAMKGSSEEFVLKKRYLCYKKPSRKNLQPVLAGSANNDSNYTLKPEEIVEAVRENLLNSTTYQQDGEDAVSNEPSPSKRSRAAVNEQQLVSDIRLRSRRIRIPNSKYQSDDVSDSDDDVL